MNATFRLRKAILVEGIACAAFFTVVVIGFGSFLLLDDPKAFGFKDARAATVMGSLGTALFGTMLLLSIYMIIAYFVEHFSVSGTLFRIRSVFKKEQFDVSSIQQLTWNAKARDGKLTFRSISGKAVLCLHGFVPEDRVSIIRIVRFLVPQDAQVGWDEFCHFVALPLREDRQSRQPGRPQFDPLSLPESARVLITRQHYDRFFGLIFALSVLATIAVWKFLGNAPVFALLLFVGALWALIRFSTPKQGRWDAQWTATKGRTLVGIAHLTLLIMYAVALALKFAGFNGMLALYVGVAFMSVICLISIRHARTREKTQRAEDSEKMSESVMRWDAADLVAVSDG